MKIIRYEEFANQSFTETIHFLDARPLTRLVVDPLEEGRMATARFGDTEIDCIDIDDSTYAPPAFVEVGGVVALTTVDDTVPWVQWMLRDIVTRFGKREDYALFRIRTTFMDWVPNYIAQLVEISDTNDQIASIMLQHGTADQRAEALEYAILADVPLDRRINKRYDKHHPHGRPLSTNSIVPELSDEPLIKVAAVAVMNSSSQILVGYNMKRACWDVPQGLVETGELPIDAAVRELMEETGIDAATGNLELISVFKHKTPEFVHPWETHLYIVSCTESIRAVNREPTKCTDLHWCAPVQLSSPRGLSLRILLNLLGRE